MSWPKWQAIGRDYQRMVAPSQTKYLWLGRMKGNSFICLSWEALPANCPLEDWIVTLPYPVFPFTFPSHCCSWGDTLFLMGSSTSSMPAFQVVTLWDVAWAVTLLLEMLGACSLPCCWKLTPSDVYCRLALLAGAMVGSRLQSTQKIVASLKAAASQAVFASQGCSAGWGYKACEQYGKAKEQIIVLIFVFLETWSMVLGPYAAICWCCAQPGSSKKASVCWSDQSSSALWIGATETTWLWLKQYKLKAALNCLLLD